MKKLLAALVWLALASTGLAQTVSPYQVQTDVNAKLASGKPGGYTAADLRSVFLTDFIGATYLSINPATGALTYFNGTAFVPYVPTLNPASVTAAQLAPGAAASNLGPPAGDLSGVWPNPTVIQINGKLPAPVATSGSAADLNVGTLPSARLPAPTSSTLGGAFAGTAGTGQYQAGVDNTGAPIFTLFPAQTGDVATTAGTFVTTIQPGAVTASKMATGAAAANLGTAGGDLSGSYPNPVVGTNKVDYTKQAQAPAQTFTGNANGSAGNKQDMSATTATALLNPFVGDSGSGGTKGLCPAPAAGDAAAGKFLSATGGYALTPSATPVRGYLYGLTLSNDGTSPNTVLDVATGVATSDDFTTTMTLASIYTKTLNSWAVGTGNGSLDTGTVAASTWYHVFLIYNPTNLTTDVLISASPSAPTLPTGYTKKRRLGSIRTNASSQIVQFLQVGDDFQWRTVSADANNATTTAQTPILLTVLAPSGVKTKARARFYITTASTTITVYSPDETGTTNYAAGNLNAYGSGGSGGSADVMTNTASQIYVVTNQASNYYLNTYGWIDTRGRI